MTNYFDLPSTLWTPLYELTEALADHGFVAKAGSGKIHKVYDLTRPATGETVTSAVASVDLNDGQTLYFKIRTDGVDDMWEGVVPKGEDFQAITSPATNADTCVNDLAVHPRYA